jgi:hypothetical protein
MKGKGDVNVYVLDYLPYIKRDLIHQTSSMTTPTGAARLDIPSTRLDAIRIEALDENLNDIPKSIEKTPKDGSKKVIKGENLKEPLKKDNLSPDGNKSDGKSPMSKIQALSPMKRIESISNTARKIKALRSIACGDQSYCKHFMKLPDDYEESLDFTTNSNPSEEEYNTTSKSLKALKRYFKVLNPKRLAEKEFFMRKIFARYRLAIKLSLTAMVVHSLFNEGSYWFEDGVVYAFADTAFRISYMLLVGLSYLLLVTNSSRNSHNYFRVLILIIVLGGTLIKIMEIEYLVLITDRVTQEL